MIENFKIENFRLFDQVEVKDLSRINLIVGKNSSGKSAFLEALLIYMSEASPYVLSEILESRLEHWSGNGLIRPSPFRHLFKHYNIPGLNEKGIIVAGNGNVFEIVVRPFIRYEDDNISKWQAVNPNNFDSLDEERVEDFLTSIHNGEQKRLINVNGNIKTLTNRKRAYSTLNAKSHDSLYRHVPVAGISDYDASLLWDSIALSESEQKVIQGLKLIDADISGITFVENQSTDKKQSRIPLVKVEHLPERVPLKSFGDGITRIFHIILSLVCAKNDVLIIDEFENGLHWSVQNKVWEMIFELAEQLNVQVFCTTHSQDCIRSFNRVWGNQQQAGSFMRVTKKNGISTIREYDYELLDDSLDTDVEVR